MEKGPPGREDEVLMGAWPVAVGGMRSDQSLVG